jgi:hypothetical protein
VREEVARAALERVSARAGASGMSIPTQENTESCTVCGQPGENLAMAFDNMILCENCIDRVRSGKAISYWGPAEPESAPAREERFSELLKAARVLRRECVTEEKRIYPTLAFANELCQGVAVEEKERLVSAHENGADGWDAEVERFSRKYASLEPVRVVDGVVILQGRSVDVRVHNYPMAGADIARVVEISVFPYWGPPSPEEVAARYGEVLTSASIPCEQSASGQLPYFDFEGTRLLMEVGHEPADVSPDHIGTVFRGRKPEFLHPRVVGSTYKMLLGSTSGDGFARYLVARRRGQAPEADNLILACVAFYLRDYGGMKQGAEAHRLINEHVLRESAKRLPEGYADSASNQLWRDANIVERKLLMAAHAIHMAES